MGNRNDWSWLTQEKMQALVDKHGTLEAVANHLGVSRQNLSSAMSRYGIAIEYDLARRKKKASVLDQYTPILEHLASIGWSCYRIQRALGLPMRAEQVRRWLHAHDVAFQSQRGAQPGELNQAYVDGQYENRRDYKMVPPPDGYGGFVQSNGWVLEHRLIMEQKIGRSLTEKEVVHHIDGDPNNNTPENLMLFPDNTTHLQHHAEQWLEDYKERQQALLEVDREYVYSLGWLEVDARDHNQ